MKSFRKNLKAIFFIAIMVGYCICLRGIKVEAKGLNLNEYDDKGGKVKTTIDCTVLKRDTYSKNKVWNWNYKNKTLTINSKCSINCVRGYGIKLPANSKIIAKNSCSIVAKNGIQADGNLSLEGDIEIKATNIGINLSGDMLCDKEKNGINLKIDAKNIGINMIKNSKNMIKGSIDIANAQYAIKSSSDIEFEVEGSMMENTCNYGMYAKNVDIKADMLCMSNIKTCGVYAKNDAKLCIANLLEIDSEKKGLYAKNDINIYGIGKIDTKENAIEAIKNVEIVVPAIDETKIELNSKKVGIKSGLNVILNCKNLNINSGTVGIDAKGFICFKKTLEGFDVNNYDIIGNETSILAKDIELEDELAISEGLEIANYDEDRVTIADGEKNIAKIVNISEGETKQKKKTGMYIYSDEEEKECIALTEEGETYELNSKTFEKEGYKIVGWRVINKEHELEVELPSEYSLIYDDTTVFFEIYPVWKEINQDEVMDLNGIKASLDKNGILRISGEGKMAEMTSRTSIVAYFQNMDMSIKKVIVEEGITSIGAYAFYNGAEIESIILPNSLEEINKYAFYSCRGIEEIKIPEKVTTIGLKAFMNCIKLEKIAIPDSVVSIDKSSFKMSAEIKDTILYTSSDYVKTFDWEGCFRNIVGNYEYKDFK